MDALGALAARRSVNLDVAVEREVGVLELELALAAAKERHEDFAEMALNLRECGEEHLARGDVDLANRDEE